MSDTIVETFGPKLPARYQLFRPNSADEKKYKGGFGRILKAWDKELNIAVAIKFPEREKVGDIERFRLEAQALAQINHPNILRIFDIRTVQDKLVLIAAWIEGRQLRDKEVKRSPDAWAEQFRKMALGLAVVHAKNIIHRDLKPDNVLLDELDSPIVVDFGLALPIDDDQRLEREGGVLAGTPGFMAPEQWARDPSRLSARTDVYGLGATLYFTLTGATPFNGSIHEISVQHADPNTHPAPPSHRRPDAGIDPRLCAIVTKAIAKRPEDRFADMDSFATALENYLETKQTGASIGVRRSDIQFGFVGYGTSAPTDASKQDRLFLDVGGDLRAGVVDHHHGDNSAHSTAELVLNHPELLAESVTPWRQPHDPFTIVVHQAPDLDCIASAYLAIQYLTTGRFPPGARALVQYVSEIDRGASGMCPEQPFTLYAAVNLLFSQQMQRNWENREEGWRRFLDDALRVVDHVVTQWASAPTEDPVTKAMDLEEIDALATRGVFRKNDREELLADIDRYKRKLKNEACHVRKREMSLPTPTGSVKKVWTLMVRDVMNPDDPERCIFFKDWARHDKRQCPTSSGFVGLLVFTSEGSQTPRRAVLSVRPDDGVNLRGLGEILEAEERRRRIALFGRDDRDYDANTNERLEDRRGYNSPDPWYDGRGHDYTIIDSPRSGTVLDARDVEQCFRAFGSLPE